MKIKSLTALALAVVLTVATPVLTFAGSWQLNSTGWWYQHDNGSYPASSWLNDGGTWYHFDSNGYMQTGWILDGNTWYYLNGSGAMQTGWLNDRGTWYYLEASGAMATNRWIGNYYLGASGAMLTNTWTPDNYYVGSDGAWIPGYQKISAGWVLDSTGWWYRNADGSYPANTWLQINGSWYYFHANGYMAANQWIGNYYVGSNGAMLTSTRTPDGYYVGADGAWIPDNMTNGQAAALEVAKEALKMAPFSRALMIDALVDPGGFTLADATYAANNCGANWYEQAIRMIREYRSDLSSRSEAIEFLIYMGFTQDEAEYGASAF